VKPRDRKTLSAGILQPQRRELVFDIDMTDYDEIRTCCTDKKICKRCWGFIAAAVKILDSTLRGRYTIIQFESS
jgi:DNA primase small subunit